MCAYSGKPKRLYRCGLYIGVQAHDGHATNSMTKDLRSPMAEDQFWRFKSLMGDMEASTNGEAIVELMDFYESHNGDSDDE